jgi:membrane associated rhomboid family serine protease
VSNSFRQIREDLDGIDVSWRVALLLCAFFFSRFLPLPVDAETLTWLFVAKAEPSPAWVFAPLLHANVFHLVANVGQLLIFGILTENRLSTREYLIFLVITAVLPLLAQVAQYNLQDIRGGVAGASGATTAVMGFAVGYLSLYYAGQVQDPVISAGDLRNDVFFAGCIMITGQLIIDFSSIPTIPLPTSDGVSSSGTAHLSGLLLGVGYALLSCYAD